MGEIDFLCAFVEALYHQWIAVVTGTVIALVPLVWNWGRRHWFASASLVALTILIGSYLAWKEEYKQNMQPIIQFAYENNSDYLYYRKDYDNWIVRVGMIPSATIPAIKFYVSSIQRKENGTWGPPINNCKMAQIGWFGGSESFEPLLLMKREHFVVFFSVDYGHGLSILTKDTSYEVDAMKRITKIGVYKLNVLANDPSFKHPIRKSFIFRWTGNMKDFYMNVDEDVSDPCF